MMPFQLTLGLNYLALITNILLDTGLAIILSGNFSAFSVFVLRQFMLNISDRITEVVILTGCLGKHKFC
jgi:ABC-type glycerol-3-phosphate transport system permease component